MIVHQGLLLPEIGRTVFNVMQAINAQIITMKKGNGRIMHGIT